MHPEDPKDLALAKSRLARKPQVGGALAALIGLLLLFSTPAAKPGDPINLHQLATIFLGVGIGLFLVGTFVRWFYLK